MRLTVLFVTSFLLTLWNKWWVKLTSIVWKGRLHLPDLLWRSHWCWRVRCASCCFWIVTTNYTLKHDILFLVSEQKIVLVSTNTIIVFTFRNSLSPFSRRAIWLGITFSSVSNSSCKDELTCCTDDGCFPSFVVTPGGNPGLCLLECSECYDDSYGKVSRPTYDAHHANILNHQKCPGYLGSMLWRKFYVL